MAAAYGALVSVMQIVNQLQNHPFPPISLDIQQAESLTQLVSFLQEFLQGYKSPFADSNEADPLEMRIADAAYAAEDVIESNIVDRILPDRSENQWSMLGFFNWFRSPKESEADAEKKINSLNLYEGLQKVIDDFDLIKKEAMEIVAEKNKKKKKEEDVVRDQLQRQVSASSSSSSSSSSLTTLKDNSSRPSLTRLSSSTDMVGQDDACLEIMDKLTGGSRDRQLIPIVGMGGIGKTTLAQTVYSTPFVKGHFDFCAWATISQQYNKKQILCEILSQTEREGQQLSQMREDKLELELHKYLSYRRFLIVLDDMWSIKAWEKIQHSFPDNNNGSRILVTTRLSNVASQLSRSYCFKMKFLNETSSWSMFSKIVFKGRDCPVVLKKIGIEIVRSCRGLPLSIVVIGGLLAKSEPTKKCWESIGKKLNSLVNSENDDRCLKILKMSYNHLPVHLKPCFLYMGVFEEASPIRVSTLIRLWVSEGFVKPASNGESLETISKEYMKDLVDRNLILVDMFGSTGGLKYCKIHDLLRDLCLREAQKERFYHVLEQHSPNATCSQRRIVIPKSTSTKKVLEALESMPRLRSYISENAVVPSLSNLRFLRILKTYERNMYNDDSGKRHDLRNMFELVNTRYLGVGAHRNSKLPSSMNLLWNLQTLTVAHPRKIDAPVEIWKMTQLRHIHFWVTELYLPSPPSGDNIIMEKLQTLKGVRNFKFDEEVLRRIPNVMRLGLTYDNERETWLNRDYYCLSNVKCMSKLESLRYECCTEGYDNNLHMITFPESLRKLSLHAPSFVWNGVLEKISSLPHLQKLFLAGGEFKGREGDGGSRSLIPLILEATGLKLRGGEWETVEDGFRSLKSLSLFGTSNLEKWTMESYSHFPCLERLYLGGLLRLKEIPAEIGEIETLKEIALYNCSESALESARKILEEGEDLPFKITAYIWKNNQALANPNIQPPPPADIPESTVSDPATDIPESTVGDPHPEIHRWQRMLSNARRQVIQNRIPGYLAERQRHTERLRHSNSMFRDSTLRFPSRDSMLRDPTSGFPSSNSMMRDPMMFPRR